MDYSILEFTMYIKYFYLSYFICPAQSWECTKNIYYFVLFLVIIERTSLKSFLISFRIWIPELLYFISPLKLIPRSFLNEKMCNSVWFSNVLVLKHHLIIIHILKKQLFTWYISQTKFIISPLSFRKGKN